MDIRFDELTERDIEVRIGQYGRDGRGYSLLLYKDARADMRLLDQAVGPMNWQRKHEFKDGRLYCSVGIWDEEKSQWVWKEDVGTESNTEKDKGQASDSFKRACTNWGLGRSLYTAPFIWINDHDKNDRFKVSKVTIKDGVITELEILGSSDHWNNSYLAFSMSASGKKKTESKKTMPAERPNMATKEQLTGYHDMIEILGTDEQSVQSYINDKLKLQVSCANELTVDQMDSVLRFLSCRIDRKAG